MNFLTRTHPAEGDLRAYLDGELTPDQQGAIRQHLDLCGRCRHNLQQVHAAAALSAAKLGALRAVADVAPAPGPFNPAAKPKEALHMSRSRLSWRVVATSAAALLALSFAFPGVRAAASEWATIFRVQEAQVLRINPSDFQSVSIDPKGPLTQISPDMVQGLVQFEQVTKPVERRGLTLEQAVSAGFRKPGYVPAGFEPHQGQSVSSSEQLLRFDVDAVNGLLALAGSKAQLPAELKGQAVRVRTNQAVAFSYKNGDKGFEVIQGFTPEISASGNVDLSQLLSSLVGTLGEELGLPLSLRSQLASMDLSRTFPLPVVEGKGAEIKVKGQTGVYYQEAGQGMIAWVAGGEIHAVSGALPQVELLHIAESLEGRVAP